MYRHVEAIKAARRAMRKPFAIGLPSSGPVGRRTDSSRSASGPAGRAGELDRATGFDGLVLAIRVRQGGLLTDGVDQHPHCVLLLDESRRRTPTCSTCSCRSWITGKLTDHNGKQVISATSS